MYSEFDTEDNIKYYDIFEYFISGTDYTWTFIMDNWH